MGKRPANPKADASEMLGTVRSSKLSRHCLPHDVFTLSASMEEQPAILETWKVMSPPDGDTAKGSTTPRLW
eukprot:850716-Prymnesium_polylepis.3